MVIASDGDDINYMMKKLTETYEEWDFKLNFDKTKFPVIGIEGNDLEVNGNGIETCE